jgi:hypothetical protein
VEPKPQGSTSFALLEPELHRNVFYIIEATEMVSVAGSATRVPFPDVTKDITECCLDLLSANYTTLSANSWVDPALVGWGGGGGGGG